MTDKTCYFVIGSEGSGTYMLAEAFVSSGCTYIQDDHPFDKNKIVMRRSLPHAGKWLDIDGIIIELQYIYRYIVKPIYISRQSEYVVKSVLRRDASRVPAEIIKNIVRADEIGTSVVDANLGSYVTYGLFVDSEEYRNSVFDDLGLPAPRMEFYNANKKYMEERREL